MAVQGATKKKKKTRLQEPRKYNVIMYNDDFTTMEFVVEVLEEIFHKTREEAETLMMAVHEGGKAIVGCYPFDIAATRVSAARSRAKEAGFPFKITLEEA
ncbi:ATP-dependent Clp protease adaptor protein ClpS [Lachnospiraceae bacterium KH1T2]|nr:ATP-dependent Clp protease adaptor protein ClpS [Lachnospiraceae bacterium KH1T2]